MAYWIASLGATFGACSPVEKSSELAIPGFLVRDTFPCAMPGLKVTDIQETGGACCLFLGGAWGYGSIPQCRLVECFDQLWSQIILWFIKYRFQQMIFPFQFNIILVRSFISHSGMTEKGSKGPRLHGHRNIIQLYADNKICNVLKVSCFDFCLWVLPCCIPGYPIFFWDRLSWHLVAAAIVVHREISCAL